KEITCPGRKRVVVIGDSLTHGNVSANYISMLGKRLQKDGKVMDIINAGINSNLAWNVLQRLDDIIACNPDYVTILIGTNDVNATLNPANEKRYIKMQKLPEKPTEQFFRKNLEEIISTLKDLSKAKIAVLSLPTIGEDINDAAFKAGQHYSRVIKEIAAQMGIEYLPLCETMTAYLKEHPSTPRYTYASYFWIQWVQILLHYHGVSFARLAKMWGFQLHCDFLHINKKGAELVVDLIEKLVLGDRGSLARHEPAKMKKIGLWRKVDLREVRLDESTVLLPKKINNEGLRTAFLLGLVNMDGYKVLCHLDEEMTFKALCEKLGWDTAKTGRQVRSLVEQELVGVAKT
nr:SGNH/GDSL hydrolase family protein [Candidatus Sigynarchaeota archaeon]